MRLQPIEHYGQHGLKMLFTVEVQLVSHHNHQSMAVSLEIRSLTQQKFSLLYIYRPEVSS
jgi:hypothetical protein